MRWLQPFDSVGLLFNKKAGGKASFFKMRDLIDPEDGGSRMSTQATDQGNRILSRRSNGNGGSGSDEEFWNYFQRQLKGRAGGSTVDVTPETQELEIEPSDPPTKELGVRITLELDAGRSNLNAALTEFRTRLFRRVQEELYGVLEEVLSTSRETLIWPDNGTMVPDEGSSGTDTPASIPKPGREHNAPPQAQAEKFSDQHDLQGTTSEEPVSDFGTEDVSADTPAEYDNTKVYEGTVRLEVRIEGPARDALHFVKEVCKKPEVRFLRLVGGRGQQLDLWVKLREPFPLQRELGQMPQVARVRDATTSDMGVDCHQLTVSLKGGDSQS